MAYSDNRWDDTAVEQLAFCIATCGELQDDRPRGLLNLDSLGLASNQVSGGWRRFPLLPILLRGSIVLKGRRWQLLHKAS